MGKKKEDTDETTALALADSFAMAEAPEAYDIDTGDGGLGEIDGSDIKIARLRWNFNKPVNGEDVTKSTLVNTVTMETSKKRLVVLLDLHKTRRFSTYDEATAKSTTHCQSNDPKREGGTMADGTQRPCEGCPDFAWRNDPETGKRVKNCDEVANVLAIDRGEPDPKTPTVPVAGSVEQPVFLSFQRSGAAPWKEYLNRHHIGRLKRPGGAANVPLFQASVILSAAQVPGKAHAIPVLGFNGYFGAEGLRHYAEQFDTWRQHTKAELAKQPDEDGGESSAPDTSFDFGANDPGFADPGLKP